MWGCSDLAGTGKNSFHPIVSLPDHYWVLNLQRPQIDWANPYAFTIGRYDEDRKGMYTQELFAGERTIHVGLDIGAPAFFAGAAGLAGLDAFLFTQGVEIPFIGLNAGAVLGLVLIPLSVVLAVVGGAIGNLKN